jgi:hypothetical protein
MGNHLHGFSQIGAFAFVHDHAFVDLPRAETAGRAERFINKAFIMTEVEIVLGTVICNKYLSMLEGAHSSGSTLGRDQTFVTPLVAHRLQQQSY